MNKTLLYALSFILGQQAHAQQIDNPNIIRASAPIVEKQRVDDSSGDSEWLALPPVYSEWRAEPVTCVSYAPDTTSVLNNEPFTQTGANCTIIERRDVSYSEQNTLTEEIRLLYQADEERTVSASDSRSAIGTKAASYSKVPKKVNRNYIGSNTQTFTGALTSKDVYGKTTFSNGNVISALYLHHDTSPLGYYFKLTLSGVSTPLASDSAALSYLESVAGTMTVSTVNLPTSGARVTTRSGGVLAVYWILSEAQHNTLSQVADAFTVTFAKN